jgi:hypothetical protein
MANEIMKSMQIKNLLPLVILMVAASCTTTKRSISSTEPCAPEQLKHVQQACAYLIPDSSCERELKIVENSLDGPLQEVRRYNFSYLESQSTVYASKYIYFFTALTGSQMMNNTRDEVLSAAQVEYLKSTVRCGLEMTDLSKRRE